MPKLRFHKIAAVAVLVVTAAWIATGEFASVGSANEEAQTIAERPENGRTEAQVVIVAKPPRIDHSRTIRVSGLTSADKRTALAARSGGIIDDLPVTKGQHVKAGDLILRLESEGKEAAVETARQVLAQREAETEAANRLTKTGNLARLQLDSARSALATARSQLELAEAELARITVRAPFDGVIDKVDVELGAAIMQGAEVATLLKLDPMIAVGEVSETDLGTVNTGDEADVRLVSGKTVSGKVRFVSREASETTRTFRIEVAIPNADGAIPAGMTAEIDIRAEPLEAVALPRSVVTLSEDGELGVRAVDSDKKVVFYPIDLIDDTPRALYLAGIPADAQIIVSGQDLVTEGDVVKPQQADEKMIRELAGMLASEMN
ncbi:RND family efflux transporter MFP subunit [Nitratireductor indicus C115]|uniref:RND family efflux transporter MFP subunit n=1 Tax=Nitratireductor indicus C115 TaxID=1231190 RepID=K2PLS1_9HYPH|nr:efflux RND transporter periplasmic adaptor subunit [Nitratireductor indicus]EKF42042.1 RND family efflux transporter MFP subunit [Nitratireductor indicus C115]SFQ46679.1 membrane fusion protein, multidrug efflux system [Nitratireductor indicus]